MIRLYCIKLCGVHADSQIDGRFQRAGLSIKRHRNIKNAPLATFYSVSIFELEASHRSNSTRFFALLRVEWDVLLLAGKYY